MASAGGPVMPTRVWIDTDAACGAGPRRDPDDCLALLMLAKRLALQQGRLDVVALGPLTNLAAVLSSDPAMANRITGLGHPDGARPVHRGAAGVDEPHAVCLRARRGLGWQRPAAALVRWRPGAAGGPADRRASASTATAQVFCCDVVSVGVGELP